MESKLDDEAESLPTTTSTSIPSKEDDYESPEWAHSLANLSTPLLNSKLTALKSQSATLASSLTAKLASSPSGQSLLHIGPSLSTLPPDLQCLLASLEPMLKQVEEYEKMNQTELIRIVTAGKLVETECRRAVHAKECMALLTDLVAAEKIISTGFEISSDAAQDQATEELNYMVSLERVAHTTLHLVHELQKGSEQVTSSLASNQIKTNYDSNQPRLPSMNTPLPQDTEKAQFMMKLAPRIRKLERGAVQAISNHFERVLQARVKRKKDSATSSSNDECHTSPDEELLILGYLFRSFALLGKGSEAESIFARVAIMPIVRSKISLGKLDEGGSRGECAGLFCLLEELVLGIKELWGDVLSLVEGMFQSDVNIDLGIDEEKKIEVDLVTAGVWVPIATALMTDPTIKMAIFSPGIASILQANYIALDAFLSELAENLLKPLPSSETQSDDTENKDSFARANVEEMELEKLYFKPSINTDVIDSAQSRLYKHSMTADFSKKWNLPIYYQLRFGEACARLDKAIDRVQSEGWYADVFTGPDSVAKALREKSGFELSFFLEVYDIMRWLWKDNVFLRPLTHRFLRGSIQLLGRAVLFVQEGLNGDIKFGIGPNLELSKSIEASEGGLKPPLIDNSYYWHERIDDVAAVSWDLTILETCIGNEYVGEIANVISPAQESTSDTTVETNDVKLLVESALVEATEGVSPIVKKIWNEIVVSILTMKCSRPLSAVKGVAATYRMTNRPPPNQASPFVATILRPLKDFDSKFLNRTPPQIGTEWKREVVASVAEKYCTAVSELTETVQRTEEALKNRKARRTSAGGMSDGEKVKLQLLMDQREFSMHVKELGVETTSVEHVKKLVSLTEAAESLLSKS